MTVRFHSFDRKGKLVDGEEVSDGLK